jgi:hypothetical protein
MFTPVLMYTQTRIRWTPGFLSRGIERLGFEATDASQINAEVKENWIYTSNNHLLSYLRVSEQRNILHEIRKRKANWIDNILRRNCLLKQVIGGKIKGRIEVTRRRGRRLGRRRKKLLDDLWDRRRYSHLKEEAIDRIKWRNRFGRGCGPSV